MPDELVVALFRFAGPSVHAILWEPARLGREGRNESYPPRSHARFVSALSLVLLGTACSDQLYGPATPDNSITLAMTKLMIGAGVALFGAAILTSLASF